MKIEIDQSGKIEKTNKSTVIAYSNSRCGSVIIAAKDKKYIQEVFRKAGQSRIFVYKTFAVAIFLLLKDHLRSVDQIIIDREYQGYEKLINLMIGELFARERIKFDSEMILFRQIGKKSNAHKVAYKAYKSNRADRKLTLKELLRHII